MIIKVKGGLGSPMLRSLRDRNVRDLLNVSENDIEDSIRSYIYHCIQDI